MGAAQPGTAWYVDGAIRHGRMTLGNHDVAWQETWQDEAAEAKVGRRRRGVAGGAE